MEKKNHTPGPWRAETFACSTSGKPIEGYTIKPESSPDDSILDLNFGEGWSKEEVAANAMLVAAAPELLKSCEDLVDRLYREYPEGFPGWLSGYIVNARAAIAKANGEDDEANGAA